MDGAFQWTEIEEFRNTASKTTKIFLLNYRHRIIRMEIFRKQRKNGFLSPRITSGSDKESVLMDKMAEIMTKCDGALQIHGVL